MVFFLQRCKRAHLSLYCLMHSYDIKKSSGHIINITEHHVTSSINKIQFTFFHLHTSRSAFNTKELKRLWSWWCTVTIINKLPISLFNYIFCSFVKSWSRPAQDRLCYSLQVCSLQVFINCLEQLSTKSDADFDSSQWVFDFFIFHCVFNFECDDTFTISSVCAATFQWTFLLQIGFLVFRRASVQHL